MNVASLELCKELYELSGWVGAGQEWSDWYSGELEYGKGDELYQSDWHVVSTAPWRDANTTPAYDVGYLLRELSTAGNVKIECIGGQYMATVGSPYAFIRESPEDAVCKLAIELFKKGVLKHD